MAFTKSEIENVLRFVNGDVKAAARAMQIFAAAKGDEDDPISLSPDAPALPMIPRRSLVSQRTRALWNPVPREPMRRWMGRQQTQEQRERQEQQRLRRPVLRREPPVSSLFLRRERSPSPERGLTDKQKALLYKATVYHEVQWDEDDDDELTEALRKLNENIWDISSQPSEEWMRLIKEKIGWSLSFFHQVVSGVADRRARFSEIEDQIIDIPSGIGFIDEPRGLSEYESRQNQRLLQEKTRLGKYLHWFSLY